MFKIKFNKWSMMLCPWVFCFNMMSLVCPWHLDTKLGLCLSTYNVSVINDSHVLLSELEPTRYFGRDNLHTSCIYNWCVMFTFYIRFSHVVVRSYDVRKKLSFFWRNTLSRDHVSFAFSHIVSTFWMFVT